MRRSWKPTQGAESGGWVHVIFVVFFAIWVSVHWQKDPAVFLGNGDSAL